MSLDLDLAVATEDLASAEELVRRQFRVEALPELRDRVPGDVLSRLI